MNDKEYDVKKILAALVVFIAVVAGIVYYVSRFFPKHEMSGTASIDSGLTTSSIPAIRLSSDQTERILTEMAPTSTPVHIVTQKEAKAALTATTSSSGE